MGFMEKAAAKLARKFGSVSNGKHEGCQIALGNDPSQKVELTDGFSQIIFVDGTDEKGRYNIAGDCFSMELLDQSDAGLKVKLVFSSGEESIFVVEAKKEDDDNLIASLFKVMAGRKTSQEKTPEEKKREKFRNLKIFMRSTMPLLPLASLNQLLDYYKMNEIIEKEDIAVFQQCIDAF